MARKPDNKSVRNTTIKVRLDPTPAQAELFEKTFGCCRWLVSPLVAAGVSAQQIDVLRPRVMYGYGLCNVIPFELTHNVPNCGYKVHFRNGKVIYATDTNNLNGV